MNVINFFIGAITGSVEGLTVPSPVYKEIKKDVYDLEIPTMLTDKKQLHSDRKQVMNDLIKSLEKYKENGKTTEKTANS